MKNKFLGYDLEEQVNVLIGSKLIPGTIKAMLGKETYSPDEERWYEVAVDSQTDHYPEHKIFPLFKVGEKVTDLSGIEGTVIDSPYAPYIIRVSFAPNGGNWRDLKHNQLTKVKTTKETLDLTPSWQSLLPALIQLLTEGKEDSVKEVKFELAKMAEAADRWIEYLKSQKQPAPTTTNTEEKGVFTLSQDGETLTFKGNEKQCYNEWQNSGSAEEIATETFFDWCKSSYPYLYETASPSLIKAAPQMFLLLKSVSEMLVHFEGDAKGNKVKTDILKHCPNVRDVMNNINQLLWKL